MKKTEQNRLYAAWEKAIRKAEDLNKDNPKRLEKEIHEAFKSVIARWYATYEPNIYVRQRGLYDLLETKIHGTKVRINTDSDRMPAYHQDSELVYMNVFRSGYHGGSEGTDRHGITATRPDWRTPAFKFTHWYSSGKITTKGVPQSFSPLKEAIKETNAASIELKKKNTKYYNDKILKPLMRSMNRYM